MRCLILCFTLMAIAADFPPPSQLPEQKQLPNPLKSFNGTPITSAKQWETSRKPELKQLFQHYMYGQYPTVKSNVSGNVLFEDKEAFNGIATLMEVAVTMIDGEPPVHVLLMLPNNTKGPVPMFVGLNFTGNHTITDHPKIHLPTVWMLKDDHKATEDERGTSTRWPLKLIAERGYGLATACYCEVIPDDPNIDGGLKSALMPKTDDPTATAAIMSWAWSLHRIADYVTTLDRVDANRLAVIGHSRLGKTALVAMAFDDRFKVGFPSEAGCGGTAPSRTDAPKAERLEIINRVRPHWFNGHFKAFVNNEEQLPFDQHCLLALCAPRPVLYTNAEEDPGANPKGQFKMMQAATPVYELLNVEGLKADQYPNLNILIDSRLGYWVRPGKHDMTTADWETYLTFADKWLK